MKIEIDNVVELSQTYPVVRTLGLYNVEVEDAARFRLDVELPVERDDWQIGVVVGPSGSGKTSIARALHEHGWDEWVPVPGSDRPVIEVMTDLAGDYDKATAAMSSVGLGSVPSWLRPFHVLSNGEQFRASMAQLLVATGGRHDALYIDEFTSILDRQVAAVGAGAFAKAWRKKKRRRVILITPHYDVLDWIEPDWLIDTQGAEALPGQERKVVQALKGNFQAADHRTRYRGDRVGSVVC